MKKPTSFFALSCSLVALCVGGCRTGGSDAANRSALDDDFAVLNAIEPNTPTETAELSVFIDERKGSNDPNMQDIVAHSRIQKGYALAQQKNFGEARKVFSEAESSYRGTGKKNPEFGSIPDQAAYQAAVCLMAENKAAEAQAAFVAFIKERPTSPLVHASHRRLTRLAPENSSQWDALLETAVRKADEQMRVDMASCGPQLIAILARHIDADVSALPGSPKESLTARLATYCGTTKEGTSLTAMVRGLNAVGIKAVGRELNAPDFRSVSLPTIWLSGTHYMLLIQRNGDKAIVFDPLLTNYRVITLPDAADDKFRAKVLTLVPSDPYTAFRPFDRQTIPSSI